MTTITDECQQCGAAACRGAQLTNGLCKDCREVVPRENVLEEALRLCTGDRGRDYGTPRENYEQLAKALSGVLGHVLTRDLTPEEGVAVMSTLKVVRFARNPRRDDVVDQAGYAWVAEQVMRGG